MEASKQLTKPRRIIVVIALCFLFDHAVQKRDTKRAQYSHLKIRIDLVCQNNIHQPPFIALDPVKRKSLSEGFEVVADIAIVLVGAFPLVYVITKVFKKPLMGLGKVLGMNDVAAAGMVASLVNSIPMFGMMKDMDNRGKILNVAFAVSAAFVFGDHLGFTAGFNSKLIFPMIVGKLVGGITAVLAALWITKSYGKQEGEKTRGK